MLNDSSVVVGSKTPPMMGTRDKYTLVLCFSMMIRDSMTTQMDMVALMVCA
jgi:hypothetical protein